MKKNLSFAQRLALQIGKAAKSPMGDNGDSNGAFCVHTWNMWATANKRHPWQMLYNDWKVKCEPLKTEDYGLYLTELNHWFKSISYRLEDGAILDDIVYADYLARTA